AALTIASTFMVVISFRTICKGITAPPHVLVLSYHRWAFLAIRRSGEGGLLVPSVSVQNSLLVILIILVIPVTRNSRRTSAAGESGYSLFMRRIFCALSVAIWPAIVVRPGRHFFNIQNPIPHPSQKEKVLLETRR